IHPTAVMSVYMPVLMTNGIENQEAFLAGLPLPNLHFSAVMGTNAIGGTGATLGLSIVMIILAKSAHMKAIGRVAITPGLFNINEPFLFGVPLMLNPLFLIPMVGANIVGGLVATLFYHMGFYNNMNPTIAMPWVMPAPISAFFVGGWMQLVAVLTVITAQAFLYLPFFLMADRKALKLEKETTAEA
ncbi:MAG: PTS transporter subunit EIIC, partial [Turicibacter sp.]|nr:PTS transporter subunit EIIC [Turicibacter sp.]